MKKLKYILGLSFLLFVGGFYGMKRSASDTSSGGGAAGAAALPLNQVYFSPAEREQGNISNQLLNFLDNANNQILIAAYWLTDRAIIEKLIDKKKKGVDVQVIIDESTFTTFSTIPPKRIIDPLINNQITLLVYPSQQIKKIQTDGIGSMHNKFVVIDNQRVFTGSANFTQKALVGLDLASNYENAVIINDVNIAQKFKETFNNITKDVFYFYILLVANSDALDEWMDVLLPKLPKDKLEEELQRVWGTFDQTQQGRLQRFFGLPVEKEISNLTQAQIDLLTRKGFTQDAIFEIDDAVSGMSPQAIFRRVGEIIRGPFQYQPRYSQ